MVFWARVRSEVKPVVEDETERLETLAGRFRLADALLGQAGVFPAGEQVFQVPVALAVAHQHQEDVPTPVILRLTARCAVLNPSHKLGHSPSQDGRLKPPFCIRS